MTFVVKHKLYSDVHELGKVKDIQGLNLIHNMKTLR